MVVGTLKGKVRLTHQLFCLKTEFDFVGIGIILIGIVGVSGRNDGNTILLPQSDELLIDLLLSFNSMTLDLQVKILSEQLLELLDGSLCTFNVLFHQGWRNNSAQAGRGADNALVILLQHLPRHMRFAEEMLEWVWGQLQEIPVPLVVLCKQDEVV